jgi:predicted nucleotidyltransferase
MPNDPIDLLFNAYRRQVLGLLLLRPEDSLHVREIARLTGVPAGSLHRELRALSDAGLLLREPAGNQVRYRANRASPIYPELAGIFRKTAGMADLLREALSPAAARIDAAFVFGSMARGEETPGSDVDVFVVGKVKFSEVVERLSPLRERLGREVNPVVVTRQEFNRQREARDRFLERVRREPRLFVIGSDDDLG